MWHWSVLYCTRQYRNDKSKISKLARFKFKDFSRIFKYVQAPYLFSSTFKGLEVFIPNSSIFNLKARYEPWTMQLQSCKPADASLLPPYDYYWVYQLPASTCRHLANNAEYTMSLTSVLWHCWLGVRKGTRSVKMSGYLSGVRCR